MEALFDPVIHHILRLVKQQVSFASDRGKPINVCQPSETIPRYLPNIRKDGPSLSVVQQLAILVGGFGNSDYLKKELDAWCVANGIRCIRPEFR